MSNPVRFQDSRKTLNCFWYRIPIRDDRYAYHETIPTTHELDEWSKNNKGLPLLVIADSYGIVRGSVESYTPKEEPTLTVTMTESQGALLNELLLDRVSAELSDKIGISDQLPTVPYPYQTVMRAGYPGLKTEA